MQLGVKEFLASAGTVLAIAGGTYVWIAKNGMPVFASDLSVAVETVKKSYDTRLAQVEDKADKFTRSLNASRLQTNSLRQIIVTGEIVKLNTELQRPGLDPGHKRFIEERLDELKDDAEQAKKERSELRKE